MKETIKVLLEDIINSIDEIQTFMPKKKDFFIFQKDIKTKPAIERCLEIIGEAFHRILKIKPDFPIDNARRIVDTRNRIIHGYDKVSDDIIWTIIIKEIPQLHKQITEIQKDYK